jgi:peptidoglycan/xylan/chitin deacetylase (PgdA/CDA1 family)
MYHLFAFKLEEPAAQLQQAMFIISIDIDVGSKALGVINKGRNDANVHYTFSEYTVGNIEQMALPLFVDLFEKLDVPATFAVRGQLIDADSSSVELLLDSSVEHDIGSHGYTHQSFENLPFEEAENELNASSAAMKKIGVTPRSFIFPRNGVAHLPLLEKYGYKCYRSNGNFAKDSMKIEKRGNLFNICPSLHLTRSANSILLQKILDVAVVKRAPLHFWFHLWNFGTKKEHIENSIRNVIFPLLEYAKENVDRGDLTFETMLSAAQNIEDDLIYGTKTR